MAVSYRYLGKPTNGTNANVCNNKQFVLKILILFLYCSKYCKFGNFREGFIFAKLCIYEVS